MKLTRYMEVIVRWEVGGHINYVHPDDAST